MNKCKRCGSQFDVLYDMGGELRCIHCATVKSLDELIAENVNLRSQLAAALAERDSANAQRLNELKDLLSCVDNVDCFCIDPPQDRGEDADNYENHASYCPDYLYGYIKSLIRAPAPLTPDTEAT